MKIVERPLRQKKAYVDTIAQGWIKHTPDRKDDLLQYAIDETLAAAPGNMILDIGCATGIKFQYLENVNVIAFDLSAKMIEPEKIRASVSSQVLMQGDAHRIPLRDESIDGIICLAVYPHIIDKSLFWDECYRVLHKYGVISIIHHTSANEINRIHLQPGEVSKNDYLPDTDEVVRQLEATGFRPLRIENEIFYFIMAQK